MRPLQGITQLLVRWSEGDRGALDELMPLVYDELHKLAGIYLRRERHNHTLQPTALINEAYVRLAEQEKLSWQSLAQFFGLRFSQTGWNSNSKLLPLTETPRSP